eukprot:g2663.t1
MAQPLPLASQAAAQVQSQVQSSAEFWEKRFCQCTEPFRTVFTFIFGHSEVHKWGGAELLGKGQGQGHESDRRKTKPFLGWWVGSRKQYDPMDLLAFNSPANGTPEWVKEVLNARVRSEVKKQKQRYKWEHSSPWDQKRLLQQDQRHHLLTTLIRITNVQEEELELELGASKVDAKAGAQTAGDEKRGGEEGQKAGRSVGKLFLHGRVLAECSEESISEATATVTASAMVGAAAIASAPQQEQEQEDEHEEQPKRGGKRRRLHVFVPSGDIAVLQRRVWGRKKTRAMRKLRSLSRLRSFSSSSSRSIASGDDGDGSDDVGEQAVASASASGVTAAKQQQGQQQQERASELESLDELAEAVVVVEDKNEDEGGDRTAGDEQHSGAVQTEARDETDEEEQREQQSTSASTSKSRSRRTFDNNNNDNDDDDDDASVWCPSLYDAVAAAASGPSPQRLQPQVGGGTGAGAGAGAGSRRQSLTTAQLQQRERERLQRKLYRYTRGHGARGWRDQQEHPKHLASAHAQLEMESALVQSRPQCMIQSVGLLRSMEGVLEAQKRKARATRLFDGVTDGASVSVSASTAAISFREDAARAGGDGGQQKAQAALEITVCECERWSMATGSWSSSHLLLGRGVDGPSAGVDRPPLCHEGGEGLYDWTGDDDEQRQQLQQGGEQEGQEEPQAPAAAESSQSLSRLPWVLLPRCEYRLFEFATGNRRRLRDAAEAGDVALLTQLLDGGQDVDSPSDYGTTSLHAACRKGRLEAVRLLLERGADLYACHKGGNTPVQEAEANGYPEVVKLLNLWMLQQEHEEEAEEEEAGEGKAKAKADGGLQATIATVAEGHGKEEEERGKKEGDEGPAWAKTWRWEWSSEWSLIVALGGAGTSTGAAAGMGLGTVTDTRTDEDGWRYAAYWNLPSASYHGTTTATAKNILSEGPFLIPGDMLLSGKKLGSANSNDQEDDVYYTSSTIKCAGLQLYATPKGY